MLRLTIVGLLLVLFWGIASAVLQPPQSTERRHKREKTRDSDTKPKER